MREISTSAQIQPQSTSRILMVRPTNFGFNPQTAQSNAFQNEVDSNPVDIANSAQQEFDLLADLLRMVGVELFIFDQNNADNPDAVFSNNWVSFHQSGKVVLYPMMAENRRSERQESILESLNQHFHVEEIIDLTYFEKEGEFLEGTGSMVFDRRYKIAYACISPRTNRKVLDKFAEKMGYEVVTFHANDEANQAIYHTNVMMCIGDIFAVVCLEALSDPDERLKLRSILEETNKYIIELSLDQLKGFTGNMLLIRNQKQEKVLVMSTKAYETLTPKQRQILSDYAALIHTDLTTIETYGGGSARCMLTEMHLPRS